MDRRFQIILSNSAAAQLSTDDIKYHATRVVELAHEKDRGIHEGLAFAFDLNGRTWEAMVDIQEGWVKIMGKDEFDQAMDDAIRRN